MVNSNIKIIEMSDGALLAQIGRFVKHTRIKQNKTQAQLAELAGLNRSTLSQIEKGESITLSSLIQLLRALDSLHVLQDFNFSEEISPLEYAKLKRKQERIRVRNATSNKKDKKDLGW